MLVEVGGREGVYSRNKQNIALKKKILKNNSFQKVSKSNPELIFISPADIVKIILQYVLLHIF